MKKLSVMMGVVLGLWCVCAAAANTAPPAKPSYTAPEQKQLAYCMWLSTAAYTIAAYKLHGDPDTVPKQFYTGKPQADVLLPLVNTVYSDQFKDAWNYAGVFYQDCANHLGKVDPQRSIAATNCMYQTLIAATARTARQAGTPKEKVYALYAPEGLEARKIIDGIYAPKDPPAQGTELQTWSGCMAPYSAPTS